MLIQFLCILADAAQEGGDSGTPGADLLKSFMLVGGILVVGLFLMVRTQRRAGRSRARGDLSARERVQEMRGASDVYRQVNELMAALADLSRQINGQIDTRLAKLEILLRQADERLGPLEGLNGREGQAGQVGQAAQGEAQASLERISEEFHRSQAVRRENRRRGPSEPLGEGADGSSGGDSPLARQIMDLSSQGLSALDIARRLERPVGEIELVLSLHKK